MALKLPLRRSPVFLLGFLPLVVLLWGWADSDRYFTRFIRCRAPNSRTDVLLLASELRLVVDYIDLKEAPDGLSLWEHRDTVGGVPPPSLIYVQSGFWGRWRRNAFDYQRLAGPPPPAERLRYFPKPSYRLLPEHGGADRSYPGRHQVMFALPFWLLVLAWLLPWGFLSWWQARRIQRRWAATEAANKKAPDTAAG